MALYTALSGLNAAQTDISVTSNNIANVGTTGFHGSRAEFGDIYTNTPYSRPASQVVSGTHAMLRDRLWRREGMGLACPICGSRLAAHLLTGIGSFSLDAMIPPQTCVLFLESRKTLPPLPR